jgi:hypothetical protein
LFLTFWHLRFMLWILKLSFSLFKYFGCDLKFFLLNYVLYAYVWIYMQYMSLWNWKDLPICVMIPQFTILWPVPDLGLDLDFDYLVPLLINDGPINNSGPNMNTRRVPKVAPMFEEFGICEENGGVLYFAGWRKYWIWPSVVNCALQKIAVF